MDPRFDPAGRGPPGPDTAGAVADSARAPSATCKKATEAGDRGAGHAGGPQKKCRNEQLDLFFLDETGFSPSMPPTYTWSRPGVRPVVPYENPQGRGMNVLASLAAPGTHQHTPLIWRTALRPWKGNRSSTSCARPCPVVRADRASWSWTMPTSITPNGPVSPLGVGRARPLALVPASLQPGAERHRTDPPHDQTRSQAQTYLHGHMNVDCGHRDHIPAD